MLEALRGPSGDKWPKSADSVLNTCNVEFHGTEHHACALVIALAAAPIALFSVSPCVARYLPHYHVSIQPTLRL